jgi:hypothetical protein
MFYFPKGKYIGFLLFILATGSYKSMAAPLTDTLLFPHSSIIIETIPGVADDSISCTMPFSRAGNLILIRARADSTEGAFILDTGSPYLVLNPTYFRDYPVTNLTDQEQGSVTGSSGATVQQVTVKKLVLGLIEYNRIDAHLLNLGHIENNKGVKVFGLLGMQLFEQFEMIIDYDQNLIYLHRIARREASVYQHEMLKDTAAYRTVPIEMINDRALAVTEIAGKKLKLLIDFAAESNVLDSRLSNKIFENVAITRRILLNGVDNRKVEALYGDLSNMKIGGQVIDKLPVLITNLEQTCLTYESCIDGILGFDFLSLHKIGFNFVTHKMYIWK